MKSYRGLHCLLLLLFLSTTKSARDSKTIAAKVEKGETKPPAGQSVTPQAVIKQRSKPQCEPNEVLDANDKCIDRDEPLKPHHNETDKAGEADRAKCAEDEIITPLGCEHKDMPFRSNARAAVMPSHLLGGRVYKGSNGIPTTDNSKEATGEKYPMAKDEISPSPKKNPEVPVDVGRLANSEPDPEPDTNRIIGHNRRRTYVFLPGRQLLSKRKCRPYEVEGIKGRCIRKKGKIGVYKHRDHKYGVQRRLHPTT